jgi:hypothetical protein
MERWHRLLVDQEHKNMMELPFNEARPVADTYLAKVFESLPSIVRRLLPHFKKLEDFQPTTEVVESLDNQYFDLEESGDLEGSSHAFSAARFAAARQFFNTAETTSDLLNAVYEAHHAKL